MFLDVVNYVAGAKFSTIFHKNTTFSVKKYLTDTICGGYNKKHNGNTKTNLTGKTPKRKIMKKIIYRNPNDAENFDIKRFVKSLNKYAKVSEKEVKEALAEFDQYETMHVSCLVEVGMKLIGEKADKKTVKEYFDEHAEYFDEGKFERLRRITGYLVGTLDRWNDAKKAEEHARVKHSVNSAIDDAERLVALETQAMEHNIAYATR